MNALTVVLILFSAAFVAAVLLAIFRKSGRKMWIASAIALVPLALVAILVVNTTFAQLPASSANEAQSASGRIDPEKGYLDMAFALISQGETTGAEKILDEYAAEYPVSDNYLLARARMEAVRRNFTTADGIYKYLEKTSSLDKERYTPEHNEVTLLMNGGGTYEKMTELIIKEINGLSIPAEAIKAAKLYSETDVMEADPSYVSLAEKAVEKYKTYLEEYPQLFASSTMELSYLKALTIAKDYATIVDRALGYTDSHSLLILAELSRNGRISNAILRESDVNSRVHDKNTRILKWIESQESSNNFKDDQELIDNAKKMLEQSDISTPKLFNNWLKIQLLALARSPEEKEASKLYLELARMNYTDDQLNANNEYIQQALITAGNSEDINYANAAAAVNSILEDKSNTENLKNIDQYVDQMVQYMTPPELRSGFGTDLSDEDRRFARSVTEKIYGTDIAEESSSVSGTGYAGVISDNEPSVGLVDYEYDSDYEYNEADSDRKAFSSYLTSQVNQITASINIASVDASKFDEVSLVVAADESIADNAEKFKKNIEIYDCGIEISDYTVEKIEDEKFNIILVCDNSGSMDSSDKIVNLKNALSVFLNNLSDDVKVGIVAFDSSVISRASAPLGSDISALRNAISNMGAYGGTDIYDGVSAAMDQAQPGNGINVMIVMSDGQDYRPDSGTLNNIRNNCSLKDVVIYSMGLGSDVDSDVLSSYSSAGGGSYTYVSDANALLSFYEYLYGISRNRYRVTYKAVDNLLVNRSAMAVYKSDSKITDTQPYSVKKASSGENDPEDDKPSELPENNDIPLQNVKISGLDTRLIYKSHSDNVVHLLGEGLTNDMKISVSIKSGLSIDLKTEYESDTSWKVTVPSSVSSGEYDVIVKVNGRRCVFKSGLVISTKKSGVLRFGDYVFEASNIARLDNEIRLSGIVTMNGWLGLSGIVSLKGDLYYGDSITLSATNAYVSYDKGAAGLNPYASQLAESGRIIRLYGINDLRLYRNAGIAPTSSDFNTEYAYLNTLEIPDLVILNSPRISVYPDRITADFDEFVSALPLSSEIVRVSGNNSGITYRNSSSSQATISPTEVKCNIIASESNNDGYRIRAKLGNMGISLNTSSYDLTIDTDNSIYKLRNTIGIPLVSNNFSLELSWENGRFKSAVLTNQEPFEAAATGSGMTYSDFVMTSGDASGKSLSELDLTGTCKIEVKGDDPVKFDDLKLDFGFIDRAITMTQKDKATGIDQNITLGPGAFYVDPLAGSAVSAAVLANIDIKAVMAG